MSVQVAATEAAKGSGFKLTGSQPIQKPRENQPILGNILTKVSESKTRRQKETTETTRQAATPGARNRGLEVVILKAAIIQQGGNITAQDPLTMFQAEPKGFGRLSSNMSRSSPKPSVNAAIIAMPSRIENCL